MKALLIIVPILLVGGVFGAGFMGVINIPGVTPKKAVSKAEEMYGEGAEDMYGEGAEDMYGEGIEDPNDLVLDEAVEEETVQEEPETVVQEPTLDPDKGAQQIAKYWDEIKPDKLVPILAGYEDAELALVLYNMKRENVAKLLEQIDPERAARLSKEIQKLASVVRPVAS